MEPPSGHQEPASHQLCSAASESGSSELHSQPPRSCGLVPVINTTPLPVSPIGTGDGWTQSSWSDGEEDGFPWSPSVPAPNPRLSSSMTATGGGRGGSVTYTQGGRGQADTACVPLAVSFEMLCLHITSLP